MVNDVFAIGSIVSCKTCYNKLIEGEVQAFDLQTKMLALKCPLQNGKPNSSTVYFVNLLYVSDVQVKKEVTTPPEPIKPINLNRINSRLRTSVEQKKCIVNAVKAGVSPDGMGLFQTISKTINEVTWHGQDIVILKEVTIKPPYKPEDIKGNVQSKAYSHIRKIVEKHLKDTQINLMKQSEMEAKVTQ